MTNLIHEREQLLDLWPTAKHEEKIRILARIAVIDDEMEGEKNAGHRKST